MQRIFKHRIIQYVIHTPDTELSILVCGAPSYVIKYRIYKLLKTVQFFWPTLYLSSFYCNNS